MFCICDPDRFRGQVIFLMKLYNYGYPLYASDKLLTVRQLVHTVQCILKITSAQGWYTTHEDESSEQIYVVVQVLLKISRLSCHSFLQVVLTGCTLHYMSGLMSLWGMKQLPFKWKTDQDWAVWCSITINTRDVTNNWSWSTIWGHPCIDWLFMCLFSHNLSLLTLCPT